MAGQGALPSHLDVCVLPNHDRLPCEQVHYHHYNRSGFVVVTRVKSYDQVRAQPNASLEACIWWCNVGSPASLIIATLSSAHQHLNLPLLDPLQHLMRTKFCLAPTGGGHGQRQILVSFMGCLPVTIGR